MTDPAANSNHADASTAGSRDAGEGVRLPSSPAEFTSAAALRTHYAEVRARLYGRSPAEVAPEPDGFEVALAAAMEREGEAIELAMTAFSPERNPTARARDIIRQTAQETGVSVAAIMGTCRKQRITKARQLAMRRVYDGCPEWSLPRIGREFGGRDHTTILHAARKLGPLRPKPEKKPPPAPTVPWSKRDIAMLLDAWKRGMDRPQIVALFPERTPGSVIGCLRRHGKSPAGWEKRRVAYLKSWGPKHSAHLIHFCKPVQSEAA